MNMFVLHKTYKESQKGAPEWVEKLVPSPSFTSTSSAFGVFPIKAVPLMQGTSSMRHPRFGPTPSSMSYKPKNYKMFIESDVMSWYDVAIRLTLYKTYPDNKPTKVFVLDEVTESLKYDGIDMQLDPESRIYEKRLRDISGKAIKKLYMKRKNILEKVYGLSKDTATYLDYFGRDMRNFVMLIGNEISAVIEVYQVREAKDKHSITDTSSWIQSLDPTPMLGSMFTGVEERDKLYFDNKVLCRL